MDDKKNTLYQVGEAVLTQEGLEELESLQDYTNDPIDEFTTYISEAIGMMLIDCDADIEKVVRVSRELCYLRNKLILLKRPRN
jgi:hypothetical protein